MLEQITDEQLAENGVVSAPDKLEGDPKDNKAVFDRLVTQLVAKVVNQIIEAHNALDTDVNGRIDALVEELRDHVDVDPGNITAGNVGLLRELADKYGLTDKAAPTVHDALEVLERWAKLQPETARRLNLSGSDPALDEAVMELTRMRLSSFCGGLLITATYASTGNPARNVYFTGLPDVDAELCRTDENGEFFAEVVPGEYTLQFVQMIGQVPLDDIAVNVTQRAVTRVELTIEKNTGLAVFAASGDYEVGEDAATMKLCAVGGGGSGAAADSNIKPNHDAFASSGGGGGYVVEAEQDLSDYVGQRLRIVVGAAGASKACIPDTNSRKYVSGEAGGTTYVETSAGQLLLEAGGGEGGTATRGTGDGGTLAASFESAGGAGNGTGVTAKYIKSGLTAKAEFDDAGWSGVRVFGATNNPVVSRGGSAAVVCTDAYASNCPFHAQSDSGVQPGEAQGYGDGGAGAACPDVDVNGVEATMAGAPGAVFIMFAEV